MKKILKEKRMDLCGKNKYGNFNTDQNILRIKLPHFENKDF